MVYYSLIELFQDLDYLNIILIFYNFFFKVFLDYFFLLNFFFLHLMEICIFAYYFLCDNYIYYILCDLMDFLKISPMVSTNAWTHWVNFSTNFNGFKSDNDFKLILKNPAYTLYFVQFYLWEVLAFMMTCFVSCFYSLDQSFLLVFNNFSFSMLALFDFIQTFMLTYICDWLFDIVHTLFFNFFFVWFLMSLTFLSILIFVILVKLNFTSLMHFFYISKKYLSIFYLIVNYMLWEGSQYIKTWISFIILFWVLMSCLILFAFSNMFGLMPFGWSLTINFFGLSFIIWFVLITILVLNGLYVNSFKILNLFFPKGSPSLLAFMVVGLEIMSYIIWAVAMPVWMFANSFAGHVLLSLGIIMGFTPVTTSICWSQLLFYLNKNLLFNFLVSFKLVVNIKFIMFSLCHLFNMVFLILKFSVVSLVYSFIVLNNFMIKFLFIFLCMPLLMLSLEFIVSFIQSYIGFVLLLLYIWDNELFWSVSQLTKFNSWLLDTW